jgi:hypothetical protein
LQKWQRRYARNLIERPPPEDFLAGYFRYEPPSADTGSENEVALPELPDYEE